LPDLPNLPRDIERHVGDIAPSYGLCGGMALAARDFFLNDRPIPTVADGPPQSGPLFDYLWQRLLDTFGQGRGWRYLRKFVNFYLPSTFTRARSVSELRSLKDELDFGRPAVLGLIHFRAGGGNPWDNHQVLAFDYKEEGNTTYIHVYDPNHPNKNDVVVRVELKEQAWPLSGKYIDGGLYKGSQRLKDVIGLVHVDVPSQNPPPGL
jgi:hypothetical protein